MNKILVLGKDGQVGQAACALLGERAVAFGRAEADFTKPEQVAALVREVEPDAIFNAAAYTAVDKAESDAETARLVNAATPKVLAEVAKEMGIPLVHFSTDYVFDGSGDAPRNEAAPTAPLGVYGLTKREGEQAIEAVGGNYLIFRTSWVYDATGRNFLTTMLRLGAERETLSVVADQVGAPTYAPQLAEAALAALAHAERQNKFPSGIYHLCHSGETSWHGFAEAIFDKARAAGTVLKVGEMKPIPSSAYPTPAARPLNSRLDCSSARHHLDTALPDWKRGLESAFAIRAPGRTAESGS